jgi:hypothetical protein
MSNYRRGRRLEYKIKRMLEDRGWTVFRCASSKPLDLVAFKNGFVTLIECKTGEVTSEAFEKAQKYANLTGHPVQIFTGDLNAIVVEPKERKKYANVYILLDEFIQFILDHYGNECGLVNLSNLDSEEAIWMFLRGECEKC